MSSTICFDWRSVAPQVVAGAFLITCLSPAFTSWGFCSPLSELFEAKDRGSKVQIYQIYVLDDLDDLLWWGEPYLIELHWPIVIFTIPKTVYVFNLSDKLKFSAAVFKDILLNLLHVKEEPT